MNGVERAWGTRSILIGYAYTGTFCLAVVLLLQALGVGGSWRQSFVVSFSIGISIHTAFNLLTVTLARLVGPYIAPIPITAIGLVAGLLIGGWLAIDDPLFFFVSDGYSSLSLGVFFGILGFIFFATRANLVEARAALAEAQAKAAQQEKQRAETELRLLQAQIEPHFLFNTLSNISSLIRTNPEVAESTLVNLTKFLRASLKRSREANTTLAQEIEILRAYLEIQKTRIPDRLSFTINVDEELLDLPFPPLLLQPLVENAAIHGIEPAEQGGHIEITASIEGNHLVICVQDDGVGVQTNSKGHNLGLANVRERLASVYDGRASLSLSDNPPHGVKATLSIPRDAG